MELLMENARGWLLNLLFLLPGLVAGFTVHECMHALVAVRLGDDTPRMEGRLTLNPGAHIDLWGLIFFVLLGWGYAKPVRIRPSALKGGRWGEVAVSLAGPASNLVLAAACYLLYAYLPEGIWLSFLWAACSANLTLCFLNLLPVPPLDGFSLVKAFLPLKWAHVTAFLQRYGIVLLLALSMLRVLDVYLMVTSNAVLAALNRLIL